MSSQKIDAVIPLLLKDYERFQILQKSLQVFFKDLGTCWVVTREQEFDELKSRFKDEEHYQVIKETTLIPELKLLRKPKGWYRQQLVKLAIATKIETEFYLTLDSDIICTKPVHFSDLIRDGKAITNTSENDFFPKWHQWAERVLGLPRSKGLYGVTPALLHKESMIKFHEHLAQRINPTVKSLSQFLPEHSIWRSYLTSWKGYLLRSFPWTEYTLYYTFMEATGLFEQYHLPAGEQALYDSYNSVWYKKHFSYWKPEKIFGGPAFFCIIQAKRGISPSQVWEQVAAYLEESTESDERSGSDSIEQGKSPV